MECMPMHTWENPSHYSTAIDRMHLDVIGMDGKWGCFVICIYKAFQSIYNKIKLQPACMGCVGPGPLQLIIRTVIVQIRSVCL